MSFVLTTVATRTVAVWCEGEVNLQAKIRMYVSLRKSNSVLVATRGPGD